MGTTFDTAVQVVCDTLRESGIHAVFAAYPPTGKRRSTVPVICAAIAGSSGVGAGFAEYMGLQYIEETGAYAEIYGKKTELDIGIYIYSPKGAEYGAGHCMTLFGQVAGAVGQLPSGLRVAELRCGETEYDPETDMFRCTAHLLCTAFMYAVQTDDSPMLDFTLRGVLK